MASKGRSMYYEFLYPKICIGAPYTFAHNFLPGQPALCPVQICMPRACIRKCLYGNKRKAGPHKIIFATTSGAGLPPLPWLTADSQFDARAVASAMLAKVRAAHAIEPDARAQPADTDRVRFRDSDRSIRVVQAVSLVMSGQVWRRQAPCRTRLS